MDAFSAFQELFSKDSVQFIKFRPTYEAGRDLYENIDKTIRAVISRKEINSNTLKRFGKLWVRNLVKNIPLLTETAGMTVSLAVQWTSGYHLCCG